MYNNPYQSQYATPYYTAYNAPNFNGGGYANMFTQPQANSPQNGPQPPTPQMGQNQQSIEYVNGLAGAQGFLMQPNSTKWLMDSDDKFFYIKSSNAQGQATVRMFRYEEVTPTAKQPQGQQFDTSQFVNKSDYEKLKQKQEQLERELEQLKLIRPVVSRGDSK